MKDNLAEPLVFRTDLFQKTPLVWHRPHLRRALQPAVAALIEHVMAALREGAGDDGDA